MTEQEVRDFTTWYDSTAELTKKIIDSIDSKGDRWVHGYDCGWVRGLLCGLTRMCFSVTPPEKIVDACEQKRIALEKLFESKTGFK